MSFENVYRSKEGITEINKIADFIGKLVIKNEYEARVYETRDSMLEYYKYYSAYTKTDNFSDYSISDRNKLKDKVFLYIQTLDPTISLELINKLSNYTIDKLESLTGNLAKNYLSALRIARVYTYDEKNTYYRQFIGLPNTDRDIIYVLNYDASKDGYSPITDFTSPPLINIQYYKKEGKKYIQLPKLTSWYDTNGNLIENGEIYTINLIPIHIIDSKTTPKCHIYYFIQNNIQELIDKYPGKTYLRFINTKFSAYYLRNLPNYSIIYYPKDILNQIEINYFFKAFNKARNQVIADYIDGFDKKQPMYNLLMIQNLLYYTIINYSNTYIEKFSLGIYTENNVDELLKSNGYDSLTKINDKNLKRKILQNLNELVSNKANNYILNIIMDKILEDPDTELKRYYLEKGYTFNEDHTINIDSSKGLENSINLVFREVPYKNLKKISNNPDDYKPYKSFIANDEQWGGITKDDTVESRSKKINYLEKKLKSLNFNSILTKYITLTRTVDIISIQKKFKDYVYLMLKFFEETNYREFYEDKIKFNNLEITPAAAFAAMCWMQQMRMNDFQDNIDDYDNILTDNCIINASIVFRKMGKQMTDKYKFENTVILDGEVIRNFDISPEITSWNLAEYIKDNIHLFPGITIKEKQIPATRLKDVLKFEEIRADGKKHLVNEIEDITDYITVFRYYENGLPIGEMNASTTLEDLINDYNNQYPQMIERITEKLKNSSDFREYQAWLYLLEQSRTNNSIAFVFKGHTKFSSFINSLKCGQLINYINDNELYRINKHGNIEINKEKVISIHDTMSSLFQKWVHSTVSTLVFQLSNEEDSDKIKVDTKYANDMKLLFDEFLSVYSELHTIDNKISLGSHSSNGLMIQLFYNPLYVSMFDKYEDSVNILEYAYKTIIHKHLNDDINNDMDLNNRLNLKYENLNTYLKVEKFPLYINGTKKIIYKKDLIKENRDINSDIGDINSKINEINNKLVKNHNELKYLYREINNAKNILDKYQAFVDKTQEKINEKQDEINTITNNINNLRNIINENVLNIKANKQKINRYERDIRISTNEELEPKRIELESLKDLLNQSKEHFDELLSKIDELYHLIEIKKEIKKELNNQILFNLDKIKQMENLIILKEKEYNSYNIEINSCRLQIDDLISKLNELESNPNNLDEITLEYEKNKLRNSIKILENKIKQLSSNILITQNTIVELIREIDKYKLKNIDLYSKLTDCNNKINEYENEISNIKLETLDGIKERIKNKEDEIITIQNNISFKTQEIERLTSINDNLLNENQNYNNEIQDKYSDITNINNIINDTLNIELNNNVSERNKKQNIYNDFKSKYNNKNNEINKNNYMINSYNKLIHYKTSLLIKNSNLLETFKENEEFIKMLPDDPFEHILSINFKQTFDDNLSFNYKKHSNIKVSLDNEDLSIFKEQLKITDNLTGEIKYYA